jgi:hypothetical protein
MQRTGLLITLILFVIMNATAAAQTGSGQVCVRAFEDRNDNALLDPGEPYITRDIGADLVNSDGVILQTALMNESTRAAQGILCFQGLAAGTYSVWVTSAGYEPVTTNTFTTFVGENSTQVLEFGGRPVLVEAPPTAPPASTGGFTDATWARLLVAGLAAVLVMVVMASIGVILYLTIYRKRYRQAMASAQAGLEADAQARFAPPPLSTPLDPARTPSQEMPAVLLAQDETTPPSEPA